MNLTFELLDLSPDLTPGLDVSEVLEHKAGALAFVSGVHDPSDEVILGRFIGNAAVIDLSSPLLSSSFSSAISGEEARTAMTKVREEVEQLRKRYRALVEQPQRFLFRTRSKTQYQEGRSFTKEALDHLFDNGALLVGVDVAPPDSVIHSPTVPGRAFLFNLNLETVPVRNNYAVFAPPVLVAGQQTMPVRAVLMVR